MVNGLQLDMAPEIGELNYKTVTIDKNDNAEGVVEFAAEARAFTGNPSAFLFLLLYTVYIKDTLFLSIQIDH